jgi:hypothetical protein
MARPLRIEFPGDEQRERVIAKICRLSTEQLHHVANNPRNDGSMQPRYVGRQPAEFRPERLVGEPGVNRVVANVLFGDGPVTSTDGLLQGRLWGQRL